MNAPLSTVTAVDHNAVVLTTAVKAVPGANLGHWPEIRDLLNRWCGYGLKDDELLLIRLEGTWYFISDIGLRMLSPRELFAANGFPPDYVIDVDYLGNSYKRTEQVARCGNAVPPPFATAIVRANLPNICVVDLRTMEQLMNRIAV